MWNSAQSRAWKVSQVAHLKNLYVFFLFFFLKNITLFPYYIFWRGKYNSQTIMNISHMLQMITNQSNSIATITMIWTQPRLSRHTMCWCRRHYREIPKWRMAEKTSASVGIEPATLRFKLGHDGLWLHLQSELLRLAFFRHSGLSALV